MAATELAEVMARKCGQRDDPVFADAEDARSWLRQARELNETASLTELLEETAGLCRACEHSWDKDD